MTYCCFVGFRHLFTFGRSRFILETFLVQGYPDLLQKIRNLLGFFCPWILTSSFGLNWLFYPLDMLAFPWGRGSYTSCFGLFKLFQHETRSLRLFLSTAYRWYFFAAAIGFYLFCVETGKFYFSILTLAFCHR